MKIISRMTCIMVIQSVSVCIYTHEISSAPQYQTASTVKSTIGMVSIPEFPVSLGLWYFNSALPFAGSRPWHGESRTMRYPCCSGPRWCVQQTTVHMQWRNRRQGTYTFLAIVNETIRSCQWYHQAAGMLLCKSWGFHWRLGLSTLANIKDNL